MSPAVLGVLSQCVPAPALQRLHWSLTAARLARVKRSLQSPRKIALTVLGLALAGLWLGNAFVVNMYRETFPQEVMRSAVVGGLLAYAVWHLLKAAYRRPEDAIHWTPPEEILVTGGPFPRRQLVGYRLIGILTAAAAKTAGFPLFFWPDLRLPAAAMIGMFAALVLLDLWRMAVEIAAYSMSDAWYLRFRITAFAAIGVLLLVAIGGSFADPGADRALSAPGGLRWVWTLAHSINNLRFTTAGQVLEFPFWIFGQAVAAQRWEPYTYAVLLAIAVYVSSGAALLVRWDVTWSARRQRQELQQFLAQASTRRAAPRTARPMPALPVVPKGAQALVWRQVEGARQQAWGLAAAMTIPVILSLTPVYVTDNPLLGSINAVGAASFYSFLLLPSLLKFDFRRDLDRMLVLKGMPFSDWQIVAAQITAPVMIALAFQFAVLGLAVLICGLPAMLVVVGGVLFLPMNVFMFASENLIFLLYPYRLKDESIEILLRTTLVFTAKGLVCGVALGLALAWFLICAKLAALYAAFSPMALFMAGAWIMLLFAALVSFAILLWAYRRFDCAEDIPA